MAHLRAGMGEARYETNDNRNLPQHTLGQGRSPARQVQPVLGSAYLIVRKGHKGVPTAISLLQQFQPRIIDDFSQREIQMFYQAD
jgi:hypothetical protein